MLAIHYLIHLPHLRLLKPIVKTQDNELFQVVDQIMIAHMTSTTQLSPILLFFVYETIRARNVLYSAMQLHD